MESKLVFRLTVFLGGKIVEDHLSRPGKQVG
jgi:hypothetical protein